MNNDSSLYIKRAAHALHLLFTFLGGTFIFEEKNTKWKKSKSAYQKPNT